MVFNADGHQLGGMVLNINYQSDWMVLHTLCLPSSTLNSCCYTHYVYLHQPYTVGAIHIVYHHQPGTDGVTHTAINFISVTHTHDHPLV